MKEYENPGGAADPFEDSQTPKPSGAMEFCVPTSAVSIVNETEQEVAPEPGDELPPVTLEGGKVTRVENGSVYFTAKTANGKEISAPMDAMPENEMSLQDL